MATATVRKALLALLSLFIVVPAAAAGPTPVHIGKSGTNSQITFPSAPSGQPCAPEDAVGFQTAGPLTEGEFSGLPGTYALSMGFLLSGSNGSLLPEQSHLSLTNSRGTALLRLFAGSCESPSLAFDGATVSGSGTWTVDPTGTTGGYEQLTGSGTFTFMASLLDPRPWTFDLDGQLTALQPSFTATAVNVDRAGPETSRARVVTVTYRLLNEGPGYAVNVEIPQASSDDAEPMRFDPVTVGDLAVGEFAEFSVRWRLRNGASPGTPVSEFDSAFHTSFLDVLDAPDTRNTVAHVEV